MMGRNHVWFISHNFPPEVNALAVRTHEHAREWAREGLSFDIITDVPHFPEGKVYSSHRNRFQHETVDGVSVYRVPVYAAENRRRLRRIASYLSFMVSCVIFSRKIKSRPTVIVASSPHIFTAFAGYFLSLLLGVPFILEVRDLWPESIHAVGAIQRPFLLRLIERAVKHLYLAAQKIIVLTESFRDEISRKGIPSEKIHFVPNGISQEFADSEATPAQIDALREKHHLHGKFLAGYIGTLGMAHGLGTVLQAAALVKDPTICFMILGTGAMREELEKELSNSGLTNVLLLPKVSRDLARQYLQLCDVTLVLLKDLPLFRTVIPSKLLESMGCGRPVILGVHGEAARVLESCGGGIVVPPEDPTALAEATEKLALDTELRRNLGEKGKVSVLAGYNRRELAARLWSLITSS